MHSFQFPYFRNPLKVHAFPVSELSRRGFRRITKQKILMHKAVLFRAEASKDIGASSLVKLCWSAAAKSNRNSSVGTNFVENTVQRVRSTFQRSRIYSTIFEIVRTIYEHLFTKFLLLAWIFQR